MNKKLIIIFIALILAGMFFAEAQSDGLRFFYKGFFVDENTPIQPVSNPSDIFSQTTQNYPKFKETFCGDNYVAGVEDCELPGTKDNPWCLQNATKCENGVLLTRDNYGNCNWDCYCLFDSYQKSCSKECNSECVTDEDCLQGSYCSEECKCSSNTCGNGINDSGEECDFKGTIDLFRNDYFCSYIFTCDNCKIYRVMEPSLSLGYEICDNLDNDCDLKIDESEDLKTSACSPYGVCSKCYKICIDGEEAECTAEEKNCAGLYEAEEKTCDFVDNDCDGLIDEDLSNCCTPGRQTQCGLSDKGVCSFGLKTCDEKGTWGECVGVNWPEKFVEYSCDGRDNDCDGAVDEGCLEFMSSYYNTETCNYFDDDNDGELGSPTSAVYTDGHYEDFDDYCPAGERCNYCDLHPECENCWQDINSCCPEGRVCGPMFADGVDNNGDAEILGEKSSTLYNSLINKLTGNVIYKSFVNKITGKSTNEIDSNTKLLLHMDDSGLTDAIGHSVTKNGDAARSSAQSKFGSYSAYFDGNGGYLSVPDSDDWNFGSGDFTIDFWMYLNSKSGVNVLVSHGGSGAITNTNGWTLMFTTDGTVLQLLSSSGNPILVSWSPSINTWYHVAVVRNGNTFTAYVNGNAIQTNTFSSSMADSTSLLIVGKAFDDGRYFNGYIDELRISKGVARWTSNFQPPTSAYSSTSGSSSSSSNENNNQQNTETISESGKSYASADGKDNDGDSWIDEGIDEGIDENVKMGTSYLNWCITPELNAVFSEGGCSDGEILLENGTCIVQETIETDGCAPEWDCVLGPCRSDGYKSKLCRDIKCNIGTKVEKIECSEGEEVNDMTFDKNNTRLKGFWDSVKGIFG